MDFSGAWFNFGYTLMFLSLTKNIFKNAEGWSKIMCLNDLEMIANIVLPCNDF